MSAAVFADEAPVVQSANIVGYTSTVQNSDGKHCIVNQFMNVDGNNRNMKLSSLTPSAAFSMYDSSIQLLEPSDGSTLIFFDDDLGDLYPGGIQKQEGIYAEFVYCTADETGDIPGWYLMSEAWMGDYSHPMNDYVLPFGYGYVCNTAADNATILDSGAVTQGNDYELPLATGMQVIGNASVLPKTLGDFIPSEDFSMYDSSIQLIEPSDGSTLLFFGDDLGDLYPGGIQNPDGIYAEFVYCKADETGDIPGWYLMSEAWMGDYSHPMNAYPVPAGTGFLSNTSSEGVSIEIPGAL